MAPSGQEYTYSNFPSTLDRSVLGLPFRLDERNSQFLSTHINRTFTLSLPNSHKACLLGVNAQFSLDVLGYGRIGDLAPWSMKRPKVSMVITSTMRTMPSVNPERT